MLFLEVLHCFTHQETARRVGEVISHMDIDIRVIWNIHKLYHTAMKIGEQFLILTVHPAIASKCQLITSGWNSRTTLDFLVTHGIFERITAKLIVDIKF